MGHLGSQHLALEESLYPPQPWGRNPPDARIQHSKRQREGDANALAGIFHERIVLEGDGIGRKNWAFRNGMTSGGSNGVMPMSDTWKLLGWKWIRNH